MKIFLNKDIKAILFDMDGVVIDSEKLYCQSENNLLAQYGVKFSDEDWLYIKGCTEEKFYDFVYSKFTITISREELMMQGKQFLKKIFSNELEYMDGFFDLYLYLKYKYKLALVTSTGLELVEHIDKLLAIREKFDLFITSIDTKHHKPNPAPYLKAMEQLDCDAKECIVVEDSIQGIQAGKAAGCYVVALEGSLDKKYLQDADVIISHLSEMKKLEILN